MSDDAPRKSPSSALPEPAPTEHGGRVELRLLQSDSASSTVSYAARWFAEDKRIEGTVRITPAEIAKKPPVIDVEAPDDLPEWLASFTTTLVRTTARTVNQDDDAGAQWPRRLTRWRAAPSD